MVRIGTDVLCVGECFYTELLFVAKGGVRIALMYLCLY